MLLVAVRWILVILCILLYSVVGILIFAIFPANMKILHPFAKALGYSSLGILGIKLTVKGIENFESAPPAIIICNHQHNIDALIVSACSPPNSVAVGKKEIGRIPFFGLAYRLTGNVLIDRDNKKSALSSMEKIKEEMIRRQINIWVLPEGTRSKTGELLPFKKGAFHNAIGAGRPIVPVCISPYKNTLNLGKLRSTNVVVEFHPPIPTEGMKIPDDIQPLLDKSRQCIAEGVAKLGSNTYNSKA